MDAIFEDAREDNISILSSPGQRGKLEHKEALGRGPVDGIQARDDDERKPAAKDNGEKPYKEGVTLLTLKDVVEGDDGIGAKSPGRGGSIMDSINALMKNKKIQPKLPKGLKPSKNSMKGAANASKEATNLIVNARRGEILSLVSIGVSMLAELYPISPHYNIAIGFFSLYLHHLIPDRASKGGGKQNKFYSDYEQPVRGFFTSFTLVISLSIFVDIDFLSSEQRPHTLDVYDIKINTIEGPSDLQTVCYLAVGLNIFIKAGIIYSLTSQFKSGKKLQKRLWKPLKYFVPSVNMPRKAKMKEAIAKRLMAIAWIQLLAFVSMLVLAVVAGVGLKPYPHFINDAAGVPLTALMAFKAVTSLFTTMSLLRNTDLGDFVKEFGCIDAFGCKRWYKHRRKRLKEKRGFSAPKVLVDDEYLSGLRGTKLFDMAIGLWVWIGLGWAIRLSSFRAPKPVRIILSLAVVVQTLSDILVPLLFLVVGWYVKVADSRRRRKIRMEGEGAEDSEDSSSSSSDDDSSDDDSSGDEGGGREDAGGVLGYSNNYYSDGSAGASGQPEVYYNKNGDFYYYDPSTGECYDDYGYYDENGDYWYNEQGVVGEAGGGREEYYSAAATYREKAAEAGDVRGEDELDRAVSCTPHEFSREWEALFDCKGFECICELNPLMMEIKAHLGRVNIFIIASGVLDGTMTVYCLGQKEGVRCYVELKYNNNNNVLELKLKSQIQETIPLIVKTLNLRELFGHVVEG